MIFEPYMTLCREEDVTDLVSSDVAFEACALSSVAPVKKPGCQAALFLNLCHRAGVYAVKHPRHACTTSRRYLLSIAFCRCSHHE